jgi:hypothetical protein
LSASSARCVDVLQEAVSGRATPPRLAVTLADRLLN